MAHPLLDRDTELALIARAQAGDRGAGEALLAANLALIVKVAKRFDCPVGMEREDLHQFGALGFLAAVERFDPGRGCRLSTSAVWWIRQAIGRGILNEGNLIRIPAYLQDGRVKGERREALPEPPLSLDWLMEDEETPLIDRLADLTVDVEAAAIGDEELPDVAGALAHLPPGDREVIFLRFGLDGGGGRSLAEIAKREGITRQGVQLREKRALDRLRVLLGVAHTIPPMPRSRPGRRRAAEGPGEPLPGLLVTG